jgi:hypothetical protein
MQNKTLLAKIVSVVALLCLALAMTFGLVACGNNEKQLTKDDKVVASVVLSGDKFQVTYVDGTKTDYALSSVKDVKVLDNGQTEVTYADGTKVNVGDANCNHNYSDSTVIKPASCCEEGVAVKACATCGSVALEVVEKDPTIHGVWSVEPSVQEGALTLNVNEEEGTITYERYDTGTFAYALTTQYEYGTLTILEGYSGVAENCFEATCALCGEQFAAGHADVEDWVNIVVDDDQVNICENEHTVYKMCPICESVLLYDNGVIVAEKEPALGHVYGEPEIGAKVTTVSPNYYPVSLTCSRCGVAQEVRAYKLEDGEVNVPADCRNDGYSYVIYEYSYYNFVDGVRTILKDTIEVEHEEYENTGEHTLADGVMFHAYSIAEQNEEEYTEDLKEFFDNGTLRWSEGTPANCESHVPAVFTCTVCGEQIVIALSGEHTFGGETVVPATCTEDGYSYKTCADCGYVWRYDIVEATGHNFVYVNFNATNATASFRCTKCGQIVDAEVEYVSEHAAQDCRSKSYTTYKATLSIGIDNETQTVTFNVYAAEEVMYHTVKANTADTQYMKFAAYNIANQGPEYDYNDQIAGFFAENLIRWSEGIPANCSTYMPAVFTCKVCNEQIVIALSGEHLSLNEDDKNLVEPSCTERGYLEIKCTDCDRYILQEAYDAVGHSFAPNAASWSDFLALDDKAGAAVIFDCADCDAQITLYAKETITPSTVGCVTTDTYKYDFYTAANNTTNYTYQVETAEETAKTLTFKYSWAYSESQGTHLIGKYNGHDIRVVAFNLAVPEENRYEYGDGFGYFFDNGTLAWNEGNPGTCDNGYALAVFECETCHEKVVFQLSGEHTPGEEIVVPADCTHAGRSYKVCTVCGTEVDEVIIPALGHSYGEWTIAGDRYASAYEEDGVVYLEDYELGYAVSVCTRCEDELRATASITSRTLPTCGADGKLVVSYRYDGKTVATTTIVIPMIDHHITTLDTAEHVVKWYDDGIYYLGYVCEDCGKLVVAEKSADEAVIDAIIADLTADYVNELLGRS